MTWNTPPDLPRLAGDAVHVWLLSLSTPIQSHHQHILSAEERSRAARFRFPHLEQAYITAHSALRRLLSRYSETDAGEIAFDYNAYGKPSLPNSPIQFNLSHSGDYALIALTLEARIGVDIEAIRRLDDMAQVAARAFSAAECAVLNSLPSNQQIEGFFNCWTRKEAYIKAIGKGLSQPLDAFDVSLRPGDPAALLRVDDAVETAAAWRMVSLSAPANYAAALAVERQHIDLHCWRFSDR